jgi:hypothetical protein
MRHLFGIYFPKEKGGFLKVVKGVRMIRKRNSSVERVSSFPRRRQTPRRSPPVTPEMMAEMRVMYYSQGLAQHEIAAHFHVNQGRVSEAVNTRR